MTRLLERLVALDSELMVKRVLADRDRTLAWARMMTRRQRQQGVQQQQSPLYAYTTTAPQTADVRLSSGASQGFAPGGFPGNPGGGNPAANPPSGGAPLQGNIFIDPQNLSGVASDTNPGTNALPLLSWGGLLAIWGTFAPFITQNTTITFISIHTGAFNPTFQASADPIIWAPVIGPTVTNVGIQASYKQGLAGASPNGIPAGVAGTISTYTAFNRAAGANAQTIMTFSQAGPVQGNLAVDTTHASRFWVDSLIAGSQFNNTPPMVAVSGLGSVAAPAQVTLANGDAYQTYFPVSLNIAYLAPICSDGNAGGGTVFSLYNFEIALPISGGTNARCTMEFSGCQTVSINECRLGRQVSIFGGQAVSFVNCYSLSSGALNVYDVTICTAQGGGYVGGMTVTSSQLVLDGDLVCGTTSFLFQRGSQVAIGTAFQKTGMLFAQSRMTIGAAQSYGASVLYGNGQQCTLTGGSSVAAANGQTFVATFTDATTVASGFKMNATGDNTAISHTNAQPDVLNANITTTPAHLDAAAGATGFGGAAAGAGAFNWNGSNITHAF